MAGLFDVLGPNVEKHVLSAAGEQKILEIRKHWSVLLWPGLRLVLALVIFTFALANQGAASILLVVIALAITGQALWRMLSEHRDRFVITNQRVFRVHGIFSTSRASVPLSRILDITVKKPFIGMWLGYGHFVFESAAQVQGLNEIRYVGQIDKCEDRLRLTMQGDVPHVVVEDDDGT